MNSRFDKLAPGLAASLSFVFDLGLIVAALWLMLQGASLSHGVQLGLGGCATWLVASTITRFYSPCTPRRLFDTLALRFLSVAAVVAVVVGLDRGLGADAAPTVADPLAFGGLLLCAGTMLQLFVFRPISRLAAPLEDVLIVGTGSLAAETYEELTSKSVPRRQVVGFVQMPSEYVSARVEKLGVPILGQSSNLLDILCRKPVSEVYFANRAVTAGAHLQALVAECERVGMPFALPLHAFQFERAKTLAADWARDGYLHYMSTASKPAQYAAKRLLDIVASTVALVLLSPLLLAVAAAVKFTSKGPVFFKQVRVGLHGSQFHLLKFRSMVVNAEALKAQLEKQNEQTGPVFKMDRDPRVTAIGRFIRKFSIDELPQLINILRGDMTIVGPRPALPKEVAQYHPWQRRRLSVRPGLTCYWQVGGRNEIGFEEWMRLDLRYVDHWNLGVDLQLILQTFPVVLAGKGAS